MKALLYVFTLLLLSISALAYDLSEFPEPFVEHGDYDALIIVGDEAPAGDTLAATEIGNVLQVASEEPIGGAVLASEVDDLDTNLILLGDGCRNPLIMDYLDEEDCDLGLSEGLGFLKVVEKDGNVILVVGGHTSLDTRKAARTLALHGEFDLEGDELEIIGELDDPKVTEPVLRGLFEDEEEETVTAVVPTCNTNDDCAEDEQCTLVEGCVLLECPEGTEPQNHRCTKIAEPEPEPEPELIQEPEPEPEPELNFFQQIIAFFQSLF